MCRYAYVFTLITILLSGGSVATATVLGLCLIPPILMTAMGPPVEAALHLYRNIDTVETHLAAVVPRPKLLLRTFLVLVGWLVLETSVLCISFLAVAGMGGGGDDDDKDEDKDDDGSTSNGLQADVLTLFTTVVVFQMGIATVNEIRLFLVDVCVGAEANAAELLAGADGDAGGHDYHKFEDGDGCKGTDDAPNERDSTLSTASDPSPEVAALDGIRAIMAINTTFTLVFAVLPLAGGGGGTMLTIFTLLNLPNLGVLGCISFAITPPVDARWEADVRCMQQLRDSHLAWCVRPGYDSWHQEQLLGALAFFFGLVSAGLIASNLEEVDETSFGASVRPIAVLVAVLNLIGVLLATMTLVSRSVTTESLKLLKVVALDESYRINTIIHSFILTAQSLLTLLVTLMDKCLGADLPDKLSSATGLANASFVVSLLFKIYKLSCDTRKTWAAQHLMCVQRPACFVIGGTLSFVWELIVNVIIAVSAASIDDCGGELGQVFIGVVLVITPALYIAYMNNE